MPSKVINIGEVARPAGYFKFKTRAVPGRNESPVANSPAFNAAVVAVPDSFVLSQQAVTSAGVYKTDGTMVRTLWSGEEKPAGTYSVKWDGTDDRLQPLPVANYVIKVLANNIQYTWEGVLGNTSSGLTRHSSFEIPNRILISGTRAYYAVGYNEGNADVAAFDLNNIQVRLDPFNGFGGWVTTDEIASDGVNMYMTASDNYNDANSFIYAKRLSDGAFVSFSAGQSYQCTHDGAVLANFPSVIDLRNTHYRASGLTLSGSYIFVSYEGANKISVLNKSTGALVRELAITAPGPIGIDGSNLWITSARNVIQKYALNADGSLGALAFNVTGFSSVVDLKINGGMLAVVDGGNSQQIKAYNTSNGSVAWTFGQLGGVKTSPVVANDRFGFFFDAAKYNRGGIGFQTDGSFWVIDPSNSRMIHFSSSRVFIEQIMYMQHIRTCAVVGNNNKRVLGNALEFEIDYTKPLNTGWKLKYNWEGTLIDFVTENWITGVNTLSNGKTYGLVFRTTGQGIQIVELDPVNGVRYTKVLVPDSLGQAPKMYADGAIYAMSGNANGELEQWQKMTLTGFDNDSDPTYTISVLAAKLPVVINEPRLSGAKPYPYEKTSTNILALFKGEVNGDGDESYHFGGMDATTGKVMFRTSIATFPEYKGEFPKDGGFDIANEVWNAGSVALAIDRHMMWHYFGEHWKNSQVNKFNHYYDNGLFIGQFGATGPEFNEGLNPAFAGNAFMPNIVKEGADLFVYHNDESVYGGLHRWRITNLGSIQEQTIPISTSFARSSEKVLPTGIIDLLSGLPYRSAFVNNTGGWIISPASLTAQWDIKTSILSYGRRKSPDLNIYYAGTGVNTISRNLGSNTGLNAWEITGKIAYHARQPNYWNGNGANLYFDILDNTGKIIVRIYQINNQSFSSTDFKVNNAVMFTQAMGPMQIFTQNLKPISIVKNVNSIIVSYDTFSIPVNSTFDAGAVMANPTTMRFYFNNGNGENGEKHVSIEGFTFAPFSSQAN